MDYAKEYANQTYGGAANAAANYPVEKAQPPQTASEAILSRLNSIRLNLAENRSSANHAADKIVGTAPTPIQQTGNAIGPIKTEHPPAHCFIDALQQVIGDIEDIVRETQEHLGRLHRSF